VKLIVGLGNPGREYAQTPHNAGYMVVDALAARAEVAWRRSLRFKAQVARGNLAGDPVMLVKPLTFMNCSGEAVGPLLGYHNMTPADLVVLSDDADLPLGGIRVRRRGSSGGHNGLKSIAARLGTDDFVRIRIGIGRDDRGMDLVTHVLRAMTAGQLAMLEEACGRAADAVMTIMTAGVDEAMNRYNARPGTAPDGVGQGGAGGTT
jgi:PTH1 family peptidyl-tRNA hydrolase